METAQNIKVGGLHDAKNVGVSIDPTFQQILTRIEDNSQKYKEYRRKWVGNPANFIVDKVPIHIDLELTSGCNLRCPMCFQSDEETRPPQNGYMSEELFKKVIDEAVPKGLCSIKLQYRGEPLIHPKIVELAAYAKQKGVLEVMFNTNATLLDEKKARGFIEANVDKIICSIDGCSKEIYESIRVGAHKYINEFEKVLRNIVQLQVLKILETLSKEEKLSESGKKELAQKIIDEYLLEVMEVHNELDELKNSHLMKDMAQEDLKKYLQLKKASDLIKESYLKKEMDGEKFMREYSPKFLELIVLKTPYLSKHTNEYVELVKNKMPFLKQFILDRLKQEGIIDDRKIEEIRKKYGGFVENPADLDEEQSKKVIKPLIRVQMVDIVPDPLNPKKATNHHEIHEYKTFFGKIGEHVAVERENDWFMTKPDKRLWPEACAQLWQRMIVWCDGRATPCCGDHLALMEVGNANEKSIEELWRSLKLEGWRKLHQEGKSHLIKGCMHCGLRKSAIDMLEQKAKSL